MAKKRERLQDTPEFMKRYGQALKRMDERNQTAEQKRAKQNKQDLKKLPGYAENYEESLIRQLFEEDLKRKIENVVKNTDNHISNVSVTANPNLFTRISNMSRDIRSGNPISGFAKEFQEILRRINPVNNPIR